MKDESGRLKVKGRKGNFSFALFPFIHHPSAFRLHPSSLILSSDFPFIPHPSASSFPLMTPSEQAHALRAALPLNGFFVNKPWRITPNPLIIPEKLYEQIVELGQRLHVFYKACNLLYRQSVAGKQPAWIHRYLEAGKPVNIIELAREKMWKNDLPCVIRPDLMLMEDGFVVTELDSVPGGIGLTSWLQITYTQTTNSSCKTTSSSKFQSAMLDGFLGALKSEISLKKPQNAVTQSEIVRIAIVVSEEARDYRPEMEWLAKESSRFEVRGSRLFVCDPKDLEYQDSGVYLREERLDGIYRFFELFDLPNIPNTEKLIAAVKNGLVKITPPLKPQLEEKLLFALFWFPQLIEFWKCELGDRYLQDLRKIIPFTWLLDPLPLPPHAVIPHLNIHDWQQLAKFSQKQRDLILKISGFSDRAWGSRGVFLGSDMSSDQWKETVNRALNDFEHHPHILQCFAKAQLVEHPWYDFEKETLVTMKGRVRLCPYYFIEQQQTSLGGILVTICPSDKKLIHGMQDAILTFARCGEELHPKL